MKHLSKLMLVALLPLAAQAGEITENYNLPRALEDCHIYYVPCDGFLCNGLVITTCPMNESVTTKYSQGKTTTQTTTMPTN